MKVLSSILIILFISTVLVINGQSCANYLSALSDSTKCVQISIAGVHSQSLAQEGYKGNLRYLNGEFTPTASLVNLQTYETTCNSAGLVQQFSASDKFLISDFAVRISDSTIRINGVYAQLTCALVDFAQYRLNNFYYTVSMRTYDVCPKLNYGEECATVTTTPIPTVIPTVTPTVPANDPPVLTFAYTIEDSWLTGTRYYRYGVVITNRDRSVLQNLQINSNNWNPYPSATSPGYWEVIKLSNGNLGLPSYKQVVPYW